MLPYKMRLALKVAIQKLFGKKTRIMSDRTFNELLFRIMFGRKADFDHPKTFNENICARKLRNDAYDLWPYTDKYEAREYVKQTIGEKYLNVCYGVYDTFEEIKFDDMPNRFALRGTHGSGYNVIVSDKKKFDKKKASKKFRGWLNKNYYHRCRERNYAKIKPRIMCDKYLECKDYDGLPEIKVFCFNGKAKLIGYNLCKDGRTYTNMYDGDWKYLDIQKGYCHFNDKSVPRNSREIIDVAEKLAAPFEFVRVDLYNVDGHIIFSELTFFSGGGFVPFNPPEADKKLGIYFEELN